MDLIAFAVAAGGLLLARSGMPLAGGTLYAASLIGFPILLLYRRGPGTVLPFSFKSYLILFGVAIVALAVLWGRAPTASVLVFGLTFYHFACVTLVERKSRYVPWGIGTHWKVAYRDQQPVQYWWNVGQAFVFGLVPLAMAFVLVSGIRIR
jgi:hypothetical protein